MSHLVAIGMGYSALALARRLAAKGWRVTGSARSAAKADALKARGFERFLFDTAQHNRGSKPIEAAEAARSILGSASHLLVTVPPRKDTCPVLEALGPALAKAPALCWIGYLSSVAVYGDHGGAWVDETTPPAPVSDRGRARLAAEGAWQRFASDTGKTVHVFRLPGIYGPGRSALDKVRAGTARRIIKPGQVFNRIHVADIARTIEAAMAYGGPETIFNVVDDEPAPPGDVIAYAARLLGCPPPPEVSLDEAGASEMARSFYGESKRVSNARIKRELGLRLAYPTYREGLAAILAEEGRTGNP